MSPPSFRAALLGTVFDNQYKSRDGWSETKEYCESLDRRLLEIRTQQQFDRAEQFLKETYVPFWLGGSDEAVEGTWRWQSNNERMNMTVFWQSGQTENNGPNHHCLAFHNQGFVVLDCHLALPFVYEYNGIN